MSIISVKDYLERPDCFTNRYCVLRGLCSSFPLTSSIHRDSDHQFEIFRYSDHTNHELSKLLHKGCVRLHVTSLSDDFFRQQTMWPGKFCAKTPKFGSVTRFCSLNYRNSTSVGHKILRNFIIFEKVLFCTTSRNIFWNSASKSRNGHKILWFQPLTPPFCPQNPPREDVRLQHRRHRHPRPRRHQDSWPGQLESKVCLS